jgi:alanyl-tRNA synthetase
LPDVIEIWNNVFIQYNREADGSLRELPAQHVDTGMGFERLTSILQGVDSNYDTDIFQPLFVAIQDVTGNANTGHPYTGKVGDADAPDFRDMAYRVVADHIRTLCFAITDGAVPSNDGRGYVLRRVLRRAVRFGRQNLNAPLGFFSKLVPHVVTLMGDAFPELVEKQAHVTAVIQEEEESFSKTLDRGLQEFQELVERNVGDDKVFSGADAHYLYGTMGFPIDLTELMAEEKGLTVDKAGFEAKMEEDRQISRDAMLKKMAGGSGKDMRLVAEQTAYLVSRNVAATKDDAKYVWNSALENCTVKALFLGRNETEDKIGFVSTINQESSAIGVILDQSSFYAEAGGQVYDTGFIESADGSCKVRVDNVQLYGQFVLHIGEVVEGTLNLGDAVSCKVDYVRRAPIASNHTMTHVLNYALRKVLLGADSTSTTTVTTIDQKGSFQDEFKSRFDFSWNGPLSKEQLEQVEQICKDRIANAVPVDSFVAPLEDAQRISSLRAVFGEKYPDPVRVVAVANHGVAEMLSNPQDATWYDYSVEFCGGTHLTNTKEAEHFVLLSEEGIAKGIRRIIFITKADAKAAIEKAKAFESSLEAAKAMGESEELEQTLKGLTVELNALSISAVEKAKFRDVLTDLTKKAISYKKNKVAGMTNEIAEMAIAAAEASATNKVVFRFDFGVDGKVAKAVTAAFGKKVKDKALLMVSIDTDADKIMVVACCPKNLKDIDCKAWVTAATQGTEGQGGGKQDQAQFQVPGVGNVDTILKQAREF